MNGQKTDIVSWSILQVSADERKASESHKEADTTREGGEGEGEYVDGNNWFDGGGA